MADNSDPTPPKIPDHSLVRIIGSGSYGDVWLAQNVMKTWRAVKVVYRDRFRTERPYKREFEGIQRFEPISRTHESQVDVLHVGRDADDRFFYYVMELADDVRAGQEIDPDTYEPRTFRSDLNERGRLPHAECVEIGISLCEGLDHLHSHELAHRDVKPANIIFINGQPKLADLGLVAVASDSHSIVGTTGYVPPEGAGTPLADIYALGRVLYEASTGNSQTDFPKTDRTAAESDSAIAGEIAAIVVRATDADPRRRHESARQLRDELLLLRAGESVKKLRRAERRAHIFLRVLVVALFIAAITGIAWLTAYRANQRADANARRAELELARARTEQAQALRLGGGHGKRHDALKAIRAAARIEPTRRLRDEAIATLSTLDLDDDIHFLPHPPGAAAKAGRYPFRVAFTSDLGRVAWILDDGSVLIVSTPAGHMLVALPSTGKAAHALRWSPDGKSLAVSYDLESRVWDSATARTLLTVPVAHDRNDPACPLSFSADGRLVATATGGDIIFYDLATGMETLRRRPREAILGIALHPAKKWMAVRTKTVIGVWDYETGTPLGSVYGPLNHPTSLAWSADGRLLAAGLRDRSVFIADTTGKNFRLLAGHRDRVTHVVFSPTSDLLASISNGGDTRIWRPLSEGPSLVSTTHGHGLSFSPDGQHLAFTRADGIGAWPIAAAPAIYEPVSGRLGYDILEHLDFSPDGSWMASISEGPDGIWLWDMKTRAILTEGIRDPEGTRRVWLKFTPDSRNLLTVGKEGAKAWPLLLPADDTPPRLGTPRDFPLPPGIIPDAAAALSADGRHLALIAHGSKVVLLDLAAPASAAPAIYSSPHGIQSIAISPDGTRLLLGGREGGGTTLLDARDFSIVKKLSDSNSNVAFSPTGRHFAIHTATHCQLWDALTLDRLAAYPRGIPERGSYGLAFSPDGSHLAFLRSRSEAELIHLASRKSIANFELPGLATAHDLRFSADGRTLAIHDQTQLHLFHLPALETALLDLGLPP